MDSIKDWSLLFNVWPSEWNGRVQVLTFGALYLAGFAIMVLVLRILVGFAKLERQLVVFDLLILRERF
jgi:hypothetical protein